MTSPWSDGIASDLEDSSAVTKRLKPTQPEWLNRFDRFYANTYFRRCDCADCRAIVALVEEDEEE